MLTVYTNHSGGNLAQYCITVIFKKRVSKIFNSFLSTTWQFKTMKKYSKAD